MAYEDEAFALVAAFLDYGSLASGGGTFAESLYSLRCRARQWPRQRLC